MSDGSFYYQANIPAVPHMHGMPYGVGVSTCILSCCVVSLKKKKKSFYSNITVYTFFMDGLAVANKFNFLSVDLSYLPESTTSRSSIIVSNYSWFCRLGLHFQVTSLLFSIQWLHQCSHHMDMFSQMDLKYGLLNI